MKTSELFSRSRSSRSKEAQTPTETKPPYAGNCTEFINQAGGDPLYAKAIVLSQGETAVALVGNDLGSVPRELTDRARRRAGERTGIPFANIVITAIHTHGGPEYYGPPTASGMTSISSSRSVRPSPEFRVEPKNPPPRIPPDCSLWCGIAANRLARFAGFH